MFSHLISRGKTEAEATSSADHEGIAHGAFGGMNRWCGELSSVLRSIYEPTWDN